MITGDDLRAAGLPPGPIYRELLDSIRDAQLERRFHNHDEALLLARQLLATPRTNSNQ